MAVILRLPPFTFLAATASSDKLKHNRVILVELHGKHSKVNKSQKKAG